MGERRRFWEKLFVNDRLAQSLANNDQKAITETTEQLINEPLDHRGEVVLVGAGPGDAGLLTLKGLQQIQQADVVVYDRLVSDDIMNLVRRDADRVFVGKRAGYHCVPQKRLTRSRCGKRKGKRVVRLKVAIRLFLAVVAKSWKHCATRVFRSRWFRVLPQLLVALPIRVFHSRIAIMPRAYA